MSTDIATGASARFFLLDCMRRKLARIRAARAYRKQARELLTLDARLLADIGINRSQAEFLAQQPYRGEWSGRHSVRRPVEGG